MTPPPSVWDGHVCKNCGHEPVVSRGYCARCYRQVARGKAPLPKVRPTMKGHARVVLRLPSGLLARLRKVAGNRAMSAWVAAAIEARLAEGHGHAAPLITDTQNVRGKPARRGAA